MTSPAKPLTFRLYPEGQFLYCEVNIWSSKKAMRTHTQLSGKYEACCGGRISYSVPAKGPMRRTGLFAEANFNRNRMDVEIMSHELTHAAFAFADRRKLKLSDALDKSFHEHGAQGLLNRDGAEERFAYALGQMCRQFTQKCYDLGIYR